MEWHFQSGLAALFIEAPAQIQARIKVPESHFQTCKSVNLPTIGNAAGFNDVVTMTGMPVSPGVYPDYLTTEGYIALAGTILSACLGLAAVIWYSI